MKAIVTSSNDVNQYNNEVQSNVTYGYYSSGTGFRMAFSVGNPREEKIPLEIHIDADLPEGWKTKILEPTNQIILKPGEEKTFNIVIKMRSEADKHLEPPFDGELKGQVFGSLSGKFFGTLTDVRWDGPNLKGLLAAIIDYIGTITGGFEGGLDVITGQIKGRVTGTFQYEGQKEAEKVVIGVEACLRPWRRINITQLVYGEPLGGITIQIQVPISRDLCAEAQPTTNTFADRLHNT